MFKIHNNWNNEVKMLNTIIPNGIKEIILFEYETSDNIGYYTISFDIDNERFIIHWNTSAKGTGCFYNEYKYYKITYEQVKQFLNKIITNNINEWCNNDN